MFKCFSSGARPKKEDPQSWEELFARPNTDSYLTSVKAAGEGSSNQREQSQIRARSDQANANNKSRSTDHGGNRAPSPLVVPSNTATRDDGVSSTSGSHFGSAHDKAILDAADELAQLKLEARKAAAAAPAASFGGFARPSNNNHQASDNNGFGFGEKMDMAMFKAAASTTVPQAAGAFTGFGASGSMQQPKASVSAVSVDSGAGSESSTTVSALRTTTTTSSGVFAPRPLASDNTGFGFGERMTTLPRGGGGAFDGFGSDSSTTVSAPRATPFTGFGATAAKEEVQPKASAFGGFGAASESSTTVPAPATPRTGFGGNTCSPPLGAARPHSAATSPASGISRMFQTAMKESVRATSTNVAGPKATVATPPVNGFAGFKSTSATNSAVATPPLNDNAGFGGPVKKEQVSPVVQATSGFGAVKREPATSPGSGFTGFGSVKKEPESPVLPAAPGFGFGAFKSATASTSDYELSPIPTPDSAGRVQMNFGTLHVSGPAATIISLKEKERSERREKEEEKREQGRKRVHFEDLKEAKDALAMGAEPKPADSTADDTDTDDDAEPQQQLYPWGNRPNFRKMLDGGRKKLVLIAPPVEVSRFFVDQVQSSYGCTYDNVSNTFFATSPGMRGQPNGTVVALAGNCKTLPIAVSNNLVEPAAIAVYQPGLSVCVVTNRGIFVFERKYNDLRETVGFLSRQISNRGSHRGIAATAGGGIVSFSSGRLRLFDGKVDNGQESILAEANYDMHINNALFQDQDHQPRRMEKSNACFMDIVNNRLAVSDLQKHVISLWDIEETPTGCAIHFVRAADVAVTAGQRGRANTRQVPLGKCGYASGIRLDAEGWVLCADADGRTIQIFDDTLNFITRVETPRLPYISGLYIEAGGHMIVCDRKNEMGGLRVYMLEAVDKNAPSPAAAAAVGGGGAANNTVGFAAAAKKQLQQGGGGRF